MEKGLAGAGKRRETWEFCIDEGRWQVVEW